MRLVIKLLNQFRSFMKVFSLLFILTCSFNAFSQGLTFDPHFDKKAKVEKIILDESASKCHDGSAKLRKSLGNLNESYPAIYVAKSNTQEFLVLSPNATGGSSIELFYCPQKILVWENGKQVSKALEITHYNFKFRNLLEKKNCDFSDMSGVVELRYQNQYMPHTIQLRPLVGNEQEQKAYAKYCSETTRRSSAKIPDVKITIQ